jgi:hypothetical protein
MMVSSPRSSLNGSVIKMNPLGADRADVNLAPKSVAGHRVIKQRKIDVSCWRGVPRLLQLLSGVGACRWGDAASRGAARLKVKRGLIKVQRVS